MCGIVGIVSHNPVADRLVSALAKLEYRGYDSAGIATLRPGEICRRRAKGKLVNLQTRLGTDPIEGTTGIGHTRWATHGAATETNAHPHIAGPVAVVHNGIIENYRALLVDLARDGYLPKTQTDSEVVALLVARALDLGLSPSEAIQSTLGKLHGSFALAFMFLDQDKQIIAARKGSPLAIGYGDGEMYLGSDALALMNLTNQVSYLEEGDWVLLTPESATIRTLSGQVTPRPIAWLTAAQNSADKAPHRHFMIKEIHEQPDAVTKIISQFIDRTDDTILAPKLSFPNLPRMLISGCGTAYLAGLVAKYWFERYARLPVDVDIASELRYRQPPLQPGGLSLFVSQSGETADTLAALHYCAAEKQQIVSLVNVETSSIARASDVSFPLLCGAEIGVASTKAFTAQLTNLACIALQAGRARGALSDDVCQDLVRGLEVLPGALKEAIHTEQRISSVARRLTKARNVLFLGRGSLYPIALEGALKLKEVSYIHAEGYAAGELKHGPIALLDENVPVVVIAPLNELSEKTFSNMQEVAARGAPVILITDAPGQASCDHFVAETIVLPTVHPLVAPMVCAVAVQLLAYQTAVQMGADVDQPRNLAKSVTVE
jgi:glucosamine--fructose-6-phosphate aminotransferase (isomerizing)